MTSAPGFVQDEVPVYWSASPAAVPGDWWVLDLVTGCSFRRNQATVAMVICVRGAPKDLQLRADIPRFDASIYQGEVLDRASGRRWQSTTALAVLPDVDAHPYCATLAHAADTAQWRLPTTWELLDLVDLGRSSPASSPEFQFLADEALWTQAAWNTVPEAGHWAVDFADGALAAGCLNRPAKTQVRCVH